MSRFIVVMAVVLLGGCSTGFYGSAPAAQSGMEYVAGHHSGTRAIWLCPVGQASAECRRVTVND
jgi:hypothetical protein